MDADEIDAVQDRIRIAYGKAYYDLDKLLKRMGLTDGQVLEVVNAFQPMLGATGDGTVISFFWTYRELCEGNLAEFESWLNDSVTEIGSRYGHGSSSES
jgi:hypothetical protein